MFGITVKKQVLDRMSGNFDGLQRIKRHREKNQIMHIQQFIERTLGGLLVFFSIILGINLLLGLIQTVFFIGIPIGILVGTLICIYIQTQWGTNTLPKHKKIQTGNQYKRGYAGVLIGLTLAKLVHSYLDPAIADYILGIVMGCIYTVTTYLVVRQRRKNP